MENEFARSLPPGLDTLTTLTEVFRRVRVCAEGKESIELGHEGRSTEQTAEATSPGVTLHDRCSGVLYVWSPLMPLSRLGIRQIAAATDALGLSLTIVESSSLYRRATELASRVAGVGFTSSADSLRKAMVEAGATTHYPAILVHKGGRIAGTAILGYKTAETYRRMIDERLRAATVGEPRERSARARAPSEVPSEHAEAGGGLDALPDPDGWSRDFEVPVRPGAYFRMARGWNSVAFASDGAVHLLDLRNGSTTAAPGRIDFVASPDGYFFVTPGPDRTGLQFFHAARVFEASRRGLGSMVSPFFIDVRMKDQYPSVGIIDSDREAGRRVNVYRVLTGWYNWVMFRDYEISVDDLRASPMVRPRGKPVVACSAYELSIPVISHNGRELAARDEKSATTKVFRLGDDGTCEELLDLGIQTGKMAFAPDGRRVAFAIPRGAVRDGTGILWRSDSDVRELAGVFILGLDELRITRVPASEEVNRLTFPEFVGRDSIMFLLSGASEGEPSRFRLVCCVH